MTLRNADAFVENHDPSDRSDYTFRFRLTTDEVIAGAIVTVVDPLTDEAPVIPTDLVLEDVSFGIMPDDLTWGVTVWVSGGTAVNNYFIRCQITTNSSPLPRVFNRTMRLLCTDQ